MTKADDHLTPNDNFSREVNLKITLKKEYSEIQSRITKVLILK